MKKAVNFARDLVVIFGCVLVWYCLVKAPNFGEMAMANTTPIVATATPMIMLDEVVVTATSVDTLAVLAHAFAMVESTDNPKAYNPSSGASGWLQFKTIMVDEANRIKNIVEKTANVDYFTYEDRWDKERSTEMFKIVMQYKNPETDVRKACEIWNYLYTPAYYSAVLGHFERLMQEV